MRLVLRHAWLNLWDKHMTTGRINQITCVKLVKRQTNGANRRPTHEHNNKFQQLFFMNCLQTVSQPTIFPLWKILSSCICERNIHAESEVHHETIQLVLFIGTLIIHRQAHRSKNPLFKFCSLQSMSSTVRIFTSVQIACTPVQPSWAGTTPLILHQPPRKRRMEKLKRTSTSSIHSRPS